MNRLITASAAFILWCISLAAPALSADMAVKRVGQCAGSFYAMTYSDGKAYVGDGRRITVIDISNPSTPVALGSSDQLPSNVYDIKLRGEYAYVADSFGGLQILDISDRIRPQKVAGLDTGYQAIRVIVSGSYAYLTDSKGGFVVVRISDPIHPQIVGRYQMAAYNLFISGSYAYVGKIDGLVVLDITDPTTPRKVSELGINRCGGTGSLELYSHYLIYGGTGCTVIDISDHVSPTIVTNAQLSAGPMCISGNTLYTSDGTSLMAVDLADPRSPHTSTILHGIQGIPSHPTNIHILDDYAYVTSRFRGLEVMKLANPNPHIGGCDTSGEAMYATASGNYAYVADMRAGVQIIDISNPSEPVRVGGYNTVGDAWSVAVADNYAYVADGFTGMEILDVSNPSQPIKVGEYATGGACKVVISGNRAYLSESSGVHVLDITNPTAPVKIGLASTGEAIGLAVVGTYMYVADAIYSQLRVFDISTPSTPKLTCSCSVLSPWTLAVSGKYAYVVNEGLGISIFDISNPENVTRYGGISAQGAQGIAVHGKYAWIATRSSDNRMVVADISDPLHTVICGDVLMPAQANDITVIGETAYVADGTAGLQIVNVSDAPAMTRVGNIPFQRSVGDIEVVDGKLYAAVENDGMYVADVSSLANTSNIGHYIRNGVSDIAVSSNTAVILNGSSAEVLDISNPTTPVKKGQCTTNGKFARVDGSYAFIGGGRQLVQIMDIGNPSSPIIMGTLGAEVGVSVNTMAVSGRFAYIACSNTSTGWTGLNIVDCSNPTNPTLAGLYQTSSICSGVALMGNYACVATGINGLEILDLTNPASPAKVGVYKATAAINNVTVDGALAYIGLGNGELQVIDLSNPKSPLLAGKINANGLIGKIVVSHGYIYVAQGISGVTAFYAGYATPSACKSARDGAPAMVGGAVVTASFAGHFYIESLNRTSGIRVDRTGYTAEKGSLVSVEGTISTNADGERFISALADPVRGGTGEVKPLAMRCDLIGGGAFGAFSGADEGVGLNNTGILIRTCGRVVEMEPVEAPYKPKWFKISDGSKSIIKCIATEGVTIDPSWAGVTVTGISSCEKVDGKVVPVVKIRNLQDIATF